MSRPRVIGVIPARLGSTRFPRKVLASQTGRPLVMHVVEAARRAASLDAVCVATDADEVRAALTGVRVIMTSPEHLNGTSRLAEAASALELTDHDIVVNIQGDEPEMDPALIDAAVGALRASEAPVATVGSPFAPGEDPANPNIVKVLRSTTGEALYFTRALAPYPRDGAFAPGAGPLKHVGIYVYRRAYLKRYVTLAPTPLELTEKLEQLRILEHGDRIAVATFEAHHCGIDTPEQYEAFVARVRGAGSGRPTAGG